MDKERIAHDLALLVLRSYLDEFVEDYKENNKVDGECPHGPTLEAMAFEVSCAYEKLIQYFSSNAE